MYFRKALFLMMISGWLPQQALAGVKYVATSYNPYAPFATAVKKCAEIGPGYLQEQLQFNRLSRQLQDLLHEPDIVSRAEEVARLRAELAVHIERLILLARPEWNTEGYPMALDWEIPASEFFDIPMDNGRESFPEIHGAFTGHTVRNIALLGERHPELRRINFWMSTPRYPRQPVKIHFAKIATLLEFCQFVRTLEIDLDISYELPDIDYTLTKSYKLVYEEKP